MQAVGYTCFYINGYQTIRNHILQDSLFYNGHGKTSNLSVILLLNSAKSHQLPAFERFMNISPLSFKIVCYNFPCVLLVGERHFDSYNKTM